MLVWGLIFLGILIVVIVFAYNKRQKTRKVKLADIRAKWGKSTDDKRSFSLVALYLKTQEEPAKINPGTAEDLDLEAVFAYIDRTNSKPGQQYLYEKLHNPQVSADKLREMDEKVAELGKDRAAQENIELQLSKLNNADAYYLTELFAKEQSTLFSPLLTFYIQISGFVVVMLFVFLMLMTNQFYFLVLMAMLMTNLVLHYKNKGKISQYTHSLPQLLVLNKVGKWLHKNVGTNGHTGIADSLSKVGALKSSLVFVNFENGVGSDPTDIFSSIFELIKTMLLLESAMFISSIKKVNKYRAEIGEVYRYVGEIDMLIAIDSVRQGLPYYSKPDLSGMGQLRITDVYHPLVEDCVPNSMYSSADKGALITGSNMSGKTTFIRAVAINTLLAQTIYTCCARVYQAPLLKIHTSIRVSDDIDEHKSYFQAEALSVLDIVKQCGADEPVKSLVIIDEIFRGTNTIERIAAAKAVLAYLTANHNFVFVSTHDLELAELLGDDYAIYSFEEQVADKRLVFDYKIKAGLLKNKNGLAILESIGYPASVVKDAIAVSEQLRKKYLL